MPLKLQLSLWICTRFRKQSRNNPKPSGLEMDNTVWHLVHDNNNNNNNKEYNPNTATPPNNFRPRCMCDWLRSIQPHSPIARS